MAHLRTLPAALITSLTSNDPFIYYNLIKFEKPKPSKPDGATAQLATDYAYITDAPYNIPWDDGSLNSVGGANGVQTYIANKLLSIGGVQETVEAKAASTTLKLSASALGVLVVTDITTTSTYFDSDIDLVDVGFREGDKVLISAASGGNDGLYVRFDRFNSGGSSALPNSRVYYTEIESTITVEGPISYTLTAASEEINALIFAKSGVGTLYSNYINREVFIYRVHASPSTGVIIGDPWLLFRGIISQGSIQENPEGESTVTWGVTSHWADFVRIQGRLTSDSSHRALSITGRSDQEALIRPEYATDYGFMHAERSINVLGGYQAQELRYELRRKGGLSGLLGGKKLVEYYETVDREVDLRFNLAATYLPIVYGIQKVGSIPVFADVELNDPAQLYVMYALCEGEIGGVFDIYVDGLPSVCTDAIDAAARDEAAAAVEDSNVSVICYGRADKGFVLAGSSYTDGIAGLVPHVNILGFEYRFQGRDGITWGWGPYGITIGTDYNLPSPVGLSHETTYSFTIPITASFIIHTGKPDQAADDIFVAKATENGFKVQAEYFDGDPANYWSTSHRLLDTVCVGSKFTLAEGEETVPDYEFVVRGKFVECYNYDHSFKHNADYGSESADNFALGDIVNIQTYSGGWNAAHNTVQIIDKWSVYDRQGNIDTRFRWATDYPASGDAQVALSGNTEVRMTSGGNNWTMFTHDYAAGSGSVTGGLVATAVSTSYTDSGGNGLLTLTLSGTGNGLAALLGAAATNTVYVSVSQEPGHSFLVKSYAANVITMNGFSGAAEVLDGLDFGASPIVYFSNAVDIASVAGLANVEDEIIVTRIIDGALQTRSKKIEAISGTTVLTKTPFDSAFIPGLNSSWAPISPADTYEVGPANDERVTINPAMQVLDYITSTRYGKGLNVYTDLVLETFLESGRLCDDQSKVTVVTNEQPAVGQVYSFSNASGIAFQGTVSTVTARTYSGTKYEVTFDNVIGKLGYKWNDWRTYTNGDIVWGFDVVSIATSTGAITTESAFLALDDLTSIPLSGPAALTVRVDRLGGLKSTNPICRSWSESDAAFSAQGYTLHDSDDVKYWKYIGWDEPEQRYVTRHQMSQVINTNIPLFDNINSMLNQFNGMMRYANGKYELDIKTAAPSTYEIGVDSISEDDIIGGIKLDDKGQRNSFNSVAASIVDPQNKFAARSISFFDSSYLKEDKGVPKQGNFSMPGISNYFNARTNIVQYLKESRYGLTASFTLGPRGYLLKAGNIIALNYRRFAWVDKEFRIETITIGPDGLVDVIATEHNDAAFLIDYTDRSDFDHTVGSDNSNLVIAPPTGLTASQTLRGEIQLMWTNSAKYNPITYEIEIYAAEATKDSAGDYLTDSAGDYLGNDFANASLLSHSEGTVEVHAGLGPDPLHVWYYWIRYALPPISVRGPVKYSKFEPLSTLTGVEGRAVSDANLSALTVIMSNETHALPANHLSVVYDYTNSGTSIWLYEGADLLVYDQVSGISPNGTWQIDTIDTTNIDLSTQSAGFLSVNSDSTEVIIADHENMNNATDTANIDYLIEGRRVGGEAISIRKSQTFTKANNGADGDQGSDGLDAKAVKLTASNYVVIYDINEENPTPSVSEGIILTATAQNIANPYFKFTGDGIDDELNYTAPNSGDDPLTKTFQYEVPANYTDFGAGGLARTIEVGVSDGDASDDQVQLAYDSIAISPVHPGTDGSAGVSGRVVNLTAGSLMFTYLAGTGTEPENPNPDLSDITQTLVTATALNYSGVPYYEFFLNDVSQGEGTTDNTFVYTAQAFSVDMPDKIEVQLSEDGAGSGYPVVARDQITMSALQFGSHAITIALSNDSHTIPVTQTGTFDFTGSGTTIRVYEGAFELTYEVAGSTTTPGTWDFTSITDINVIANTNPTEVSDGSVIIEDLTGWNGDKDSADILPTEFTGSVTFEIAGARLDGTPFSFDKFQSFALSLGGIDGAAGADGSAGLGSRGVNLTAGTLIFTYAEDGTTPTGGEGSDVTTTIVTASPVNTEGTPYYEFYIDDISQLDSSVDPTVNTFEYSAPSTSAIMPQKIEVELREDSTVSAVLARDQVTMSALQIGGNAISIIMPNEAHTIPTDELGANGDYTNSGTTIRVFEGATALIYQKPGDTVNDGQWSMTATPTDITAGTLTEGDGTTTAIVGEAIDMTTGVTPAVAKVVYTITGKRLNGTVFPATGTLTKDQTFSKSLKGTDGSVGSAGADGYNGLTIILTNEAHTIPCDETGTPTDFTGSGTEIRVFEGNSELTWDGVGTTAGKYDVSIASSANITEDPSDSGTGSPVHAIYSAITGMSADSAFIDYSISGKRLDGTAFGPIHKIMSFSKSIKGDFGQDAVTVDLSFSSQIVKYDKDGSNPIPNTTTDITLTANPKNISTPFYKFTGDGDGTPMGFVDDTNFGAYSPKTWQVPADLSTWDNNPASVRVGVSATSGTGSELSYDIVTLVGVKGEGAQGSQGSQGATGDPGDPGDIVDTLTDQTISSGLTGTNGVAYKIDNDGDIKKYAGNDNTLLITQPITTIETWLPSGGTASNYSVSAQLAYSYGIGDIQGDLLESWLPMTQDRWWWIGTTSAIKDVKFKVEIKNSLNTIVGSAWIYMDVDGTGA